ncbi:hypothetical protein Bca4012_062613 [Brassica carinata]
MRIFGDQITKEEERIAKKMMLVGLWCIQTNPSDRPPMIKVIEMLEGNLEDLQVPPKPLFCLPTATVHETLEDNRHEISSSSEPKARGRKLTGCAETFSCGSLDFNFPFFNITMQSRCGLFRLKCTDYQISEIQLEENGEWYEVKSVSQANTITVSDRRLNRSLESGTCSGFSRFSLPDSPWLNMTTLYKCNNSSENGFTYANCKGGGSSLYYSDLQDTSGCSAIKTPESWVNPSHKNQSILNATFSLHIHLPPGCYRCHREGGECTMIKEEFRCQGGTPRRRRKEDYQGEKLKLGLGKMKCSVLHLQFNDDLKAAFKKQSSGTDLNRTLEPTSESKLSKKKLVVSLSCFDCDDHYHDRDNSESKKTRKSDWNVESVEAVVMLKRYSYEKVKKMINSFAHVLGKGEFGTVYKGKLPDGGVDVAVKILKEGKGTGEEFINEVASMSRTSHVNIVSLLGFCYEGNKRAIVYEFMPNGSLDKFISENMSTKIEWEILYDIAVGIYLSRLRVFTQPLCIEDCAFRYKATKRTNCGNRNSHRQFPIKICGGKPS